MAGIRVSKPSLPTVLSCVALFAALGGVGYASGTFDGAGEKRAALQSGKTLKGLYLVQDVESGTGAGSFADGVVTYQQPLRFVPTRHFVPESQTPPAECPGTPVKPKAVPGHLCVYEADGFQRDAGDVTFQEGDARDKLGFGVEALSAAAQNVTYGSKGSWAVSAP